MSTSGSGSAFFSKQLDLLAKETTKVLIGDIRKAGADLNPFLDNTAACPSDAYTLNKKFMTSPSFTTYSLPSARILPASLAPASPL